MSSSTDAPAITKSSCLICVELCKLIDQDTRQMDEHAYNVKKLYSPFLIVQELANLPRLKSTIKPEILTLLVGPNKQPMICHRALLAYHSQFFDAACFGGFQEAGANEIVLAEEDADDMSEFIGWLYTGNCTTRGHAAGDLSRLLRLWVLGDRLVAAHFCNAAMRAMCQWFVRGYLNAADARYAYENTAEGSKLRRFMRDSIVAEGPFIEENDLHFDREQWIELIRDGGDLVFDVVLNGGFSAVYGNVPSDGENRLSYMRECRDLSVESWLASKMDGEAGSKQ